MVTAVDLPYLAEGTGWGFEEFARRHGDYALAAVAVTMGRRGDRAHNVRIAVMGVGDTPAPDAGGGSGAGGKRSRSAACLGRSGSRLRRSEYRPARVRRLSPSSGGRAGGQGTCRRLGARGGDRAMTATHDISITVNGSVYRRRVEGAAAAVRFPARRSRPDRHPCRLRTWRLRRLHRHHGRAQHPVLPDARGAGRWRGSRNGRGAWHRPRRSIHCRQAFQDHHALQCGFCTPGFLMACTDMLRLLPLATDAEIREALSGNICRCTGYEHIVNAVREVVQKRGPLA